MPKVELLSPVGDFECLKAAVQNGADSVYFGAEDFNARVFANNFTIDDIEKVINYCKIRNVKTNLTLNTLLKNSEFDKAFEVAKKAYEAGIDAIIVQDLGLAKFLIKNFPDLPIHASTQMTAHNLQGVLELEKLGFKRVVLARELSIEEIEYICAHTNVQIETFIHGALCICYSGQCLFSSSVGGRSANRGKCAGPCRLPYELLCVSNKNSNNSQINITNNEKIENNLTEKTTTLEKGYLLSPKDLCGIAYIPRLINAGIKCLKIEGRMKSPEYVATVTRIYRKYIDMVLNEEEFIIDEKDVNALMQVFNRGGFSSGHLDGSKPNRNLVFPEKPNNVGIYLGTISHYNSNKGHITLKLEENLQIGDSIAVSKESSTYFVSELMKKNTNLKNAKPNDEVTIGRMKGHIAVGDKVYKISSKTLSDLARASYENVENKKIPLNCIVTIKKDEPIKMEVSTSKETKSSSPYKNICITEISDTIPIGALKTPISVERVVKQISKTNNTPYTFENITVLLDDGLYVPSISTLNELRRKALENLENEIIKRIKRTAPKVSFDKTETITYIPNKSNPNVSLSLRHLFADYDYTKLHKDKISKIYLALKLFVNKEYEDIIQYLSENYDIYIYMPSIIKANYKNIILSSLDNITKKFNIKGFVISNLADFNFLERYKNDYDFVGNYSLNVFNNHTMEEYKNLGLNKVTLSRELTFEGIKEILETSDIDSELIVYGNLPIMATNYCFVGKTNACYPDCKESCMKNTYYLKDRLGFTFRIIPDNLQTVTLICNSKTLSIPTKDLPITSVRVDMIDETIDEMNEVIDCVYDRGKLEGKQYTNGNLYREV